MTIMLVLAAVGVWAAGLLGVVALCRSAAHGDRWLQDMDRSTGGGRRARRFERPPGGRARRRVAAH